MEVSVNTAFYFLAEEHLQDATIRLLTWKTKAVTCLGPVNTVTATIEGAQFILGDSASKLSSLIRLSHIAAARV